MGTFFAFRAEGYGAQWRGGGFILGLTGSDMLLLRLAVVLAAILVGGSVVAYLATGHVEYRQFAWRVAKYAIIVVLCILTLLFMERVFVVAPL